MTPWLRYLLAFIIFCHGFIYIRIGAVLPDPIKQWNGRSRLLGSTIAQTPVMAIVRGVHVLAGILTLAAAVAIGFSSGSWRLLAGLGSIVGVAAFALFWDGQAQFFSEEGGIGAVVSLMLLLAAGLA